MGSTWSVTQAREALFWLIMFTGCQTAPREHARGNGKAAAGDSAAVRSEPAQAPKDEQDLLRSLRGTDREAKLAAVRVLEAKQEGASFATVDLCHVARDQAEDEEVRCAVIDALPEINPTSDHVRAAFQSLLVDAPDELRWLAACRASRVGVEARSSVPVLEDGLRSGRPGIEEITAAALLESGAPGLEALIRGLTDPSTRVRAVAAATLWKMGASGTKPLSVTAAPALARALQDRDATVRRRAAMALGSIPSNEPEILVALGAALKDPEQDVRWNALLALRERGAAARMCRDEVLSILRGPTFHVCAVDILCGLEGSEAVDSLILALNAREARLAVVRGVMSLGSRAVPAIPALIDTLDDEGVEEEVREALHGLGRPALDLLVAALPDVRATCREGVVRAIGDFARDAHDGAAAVRALKRLSTDSDPLTREAASRALLEAEDSSDK